MREKLRPPSIELSDMRDSQGAELRYANIEHVPLLQRVGQSKKQSNFCCHKSPPENRRIQLSGQTTRSFPSNAVKNTKYNIFTFLPLFLFYQFKQPLSLFFLVISLSQFYPPLQVGFLITYIAPLGLVLAITLGKESYDDIIRWKRDRDVNKQKYTRITSSREVLIASENIKVGHVIKIHAHERIPADMILLHTQDKNGTVFIKTDQLDGETDWKLRKAVNATQSVRNEADVLAVKGTLTVEPPRKEIYEFQGKLELPDGEIGLMLDNTLWATTTLAAGSCIGIVIYTGKETRSVMNSREPSNKLGRTDEELNKLAVYLLFLMAFLAIVMLCLSGFNSYSHIIGFRYILLLSTIIPISLKVNLDFAKIYYCLGISRDSLVGNAKPRNSTIPEELGRIHFLLTDKTGTLTCNEMTLKKLALEHAAFELDDKESKASLLNELNFSFENIKRKAPESKKARRRELHLVIRDMITALSLCHNVTPVEEDGKQIYQASSPDEVALVEFTKTIGVELVQRTQETIVLNTPRGIEEYQILDIFPFTSDTKRMGIILRSESTNKITFYLKGAEEALLPKINSQSSQEKMKEDCEILAQEGLRTLVITQRTVSDEEYEVFRREIEKARATMLHREKMIRKAIESIEVEMEYLGVTGVEDKLQNRVDRCISKLTNAGIRIWMLTGDKVETAKCIAISTGLKGKNQKFKELANMRDPILIENELNDLKLTGNNSIVLIIDGITLTLIMEQNPELFILAATRVGGVICCRVSPTQKTQIVENIQKYTENRVCSIGDGGNDVGMIQAAHVGIGIEGKEGKQASLAADFSINEFKYLAPLILWHGRLSYMRTARLANFIFHRGLIIAVIQAYFILVFYYIAIPIYNGYLMLGYATIFTCLPVFSLVLDKDVNYKTIRKFPILYQSLQLGRDLNETRFLLWIWKSLYQGSVIILMALSLFPEDNFVNLVAITFSALILTELLNVATEIDTWNKWIVVSELSTLVVYLICICLLKNYFNLELIIRSDFFWKILAITAVSWVPLHIIKIVFEKINPPTSKKVKQSK